MWRRGPCSHRPSAPRILRDGGLRNSKVSKSDPRESGFPAVAPPRLLRYRRASRRAGGGRRVAPSLMSQEDPLMTAHSFDPLAATAAALTPSTAALQAMSERFQEEIERGLGGRGGSLKVLPTFLRQPRGDERGEVLFVDWGGTRGRAGRVRLGGDGHVDMVQEDVFTFSSEDKAEPADHVFDTIAAALERVAGRDRSSRPLGLSYSFPARLERIDRAIALPLTKGWQLPGLEATMWSGSSRGRSSGA